MSSNTSPESDLTGSVDERMQQLADTPMSAQTSAWLRHQLDATLTAWAADRTTLDIDQEGRTDF